MQDNPNTRDPEYNSEAIHSDADDPWFTRETPADETYHPYEEPVVHQYTENHEYAPQERETRTGAVPAYTPLVNTGDEYPPEPYNPAPEADNLHIVTYGTVEDVAFADDGEERRNGLVSMSIRDEMDDLIHTDFHTLNPLSLLGGENVKIGDRVRVDIQDYKNVIEWFVYNYPTRLKYTDLLVPRIADGPWFELDGRDWIGGDIEHDPVLTTPHIKTTGEDWENQDTGSLLDKSYLEIGQRDGNKKITLRQFLQLINDYFQIDRLWMAVRDHEKRLVQLEKDLRAEDEARNNRVYKEIDQSFYHRTPTSDWPPSAANRGFPSLFIGNLENREFSLNIMYRDNLKGEPHEDADEPGGDPWSGKGPWSNPETRGGEECFQIFNEGAIPEEFRPTKFHWIPNYGIMTQRIGGWESIVNGVGGCDIGFDTDGSVWISAKDVRDGYIKPEWPGKLGIFGPSGMIDHQWLKPNDQGTSTWYWLIDIITTGGIITMGSKGDPW